MRSVLVYSIPLLVRERSAVLGVVRMDVWFIRLLFSFLDARFLDQGFQRRGAFVQGIGCHRLVIVVDCGCV